LLLDLKLPATSANLGPGFDAMALAMDLHLRLQAELADRFSISAEGRDREICGKVEDHLILRTYEEVFASEGKPVPPVRLHIANAIPIGKGCGSSAAARLAGIALAVRAGGLGWDDNRIIAEAARREGHPDNAAACWMGGIVIARMDPGTGELTALAVESRYSGPLLLAISEAPYSTEEARRVLPRQYSRADAVANVQNALLLLAGFQQGRTDLLGASMNDRIHEPYRAPLCPLLPCLRQLAPREGILGIALSGAGPSVLIFLDPEVPAERTRAVVSAALQNSGLRAELLLTSIARRSG
jgi:homoserine kinase